MQYYTCGTSYAEVEVDILTGSHMVLHVSIVMDVGRSINPIVDIGQIEGGFMIGQGIYTTEQLIYDTKGGLVTCGPSQYKVCAHYPFFNSWNLDNSANFVFSFHVVDTICGRRSRGAQCYTL
jgi:xanthine dehydrogenase molybdopterin-binding subunit B